MFAAVRHAVARRGFKVILMMRLVPTPMSVLNYLLGVTGVQLWTYLAAAVIGYIPSSVLFVSIGLVGKRVAR